MRRKKLIQSCLHRAMGTDFLVHIHVWRWYRLKDQMKTLVKITVKVNKEFLKSCEVCKPPFFVSFSDTSFLYKISVNVKCLVELNTVILFGTQRHMT